MTIASQDSSDKKVERRERRIQKRRREILAAAKKVFIAGSYGNVTMDEIADAADISKATLYLYFKTKADIFENVLTSDMEFLVDSLRGAVDANVTQAENLFSLAKVYAEYFHEHSEYFSKLSFFYYPGRDEVLAEPLALEISKRLTTAIKVVEACINAGVGTGEFRTDDPWATALSVWALWEGSAQAAATGRTEKMGRSHQEIVRAGMISLIEGLCPPVAKPTREALRARI